MEIPMRVRRHPGEVLQEEFMVPLALSASALARSLNVPVNRITHIINQERSVTADTAIRLGRYFGTTPQFWLNLQTDYDLSRAFTERGAEINDHVRPRVATQKWKGPPPARQPKESSYEPWSSSADAAVPQR
jgi:antitoxin HigA-1